MENIILTRENLSIICRLCLKYSDFSISIYNRVDPNPNKKCLKDRIFEMFSIKISATDGLPTNICYRCLYYTEMYTDFREDIRLCETKLQKFNVSANSNSNFPFIPSSLLSERTVNGRFQLRADDDFVTIIDPDKDYESSDEESSISEIDNSVASNTSISPEKQPMPIKVNRFKTQQIKNVFFCEYCDRAFVNQEECLNHESFNHNQLNPHICTFCNFQCASRNTIIAHIKECHDSKPFFCTQCEKKFGRRSDLRKHSVVHTGIRPYRCKVCNKNFSRNTNLTKHLRIHEKSQFKRDDELQVVKSSQNRNDTENIVISLDPFDDQDSNVDDDNHLKTLIQRRNTTIDQTEPLLTNKPQNNNPNQSANTGISFCLPPIHMTLPNPINIPAPKPSIPVPVQSIDPIDIEPEPESNISSFLRENIQADRDYARHVTGDAVTFRPNKFNKEPVIKPKIFVCDNCPKKFATQSSLLNHKSIHSELRLHICATCNKSFTRKRELDRHSTIHVTNKPFGCTQCPKKFGRKDKLVRHERTHLEVRIFSCPKCQLAFNRKEAMLLHMKVHTEDEPNFGLRNLMTNPTLGKKLIRHELDALK